MEQVQGQVQVQVLGGSDPGSTGGGGVGEGQLGSSHISIGEYLWDIFFFSFLCLGGAIYTVVEILINLYM